MCKIRHLDCNTSSVHSGIKSFSKRRMATISRWRGLFLDILRQIRDVYTALHQDTDSASTRFSASTGDWDDILFELSSYPVCNVAGHIHDDSASTTFARTVLHDTAALDPASHPSPDVPSSSVPDPLHVDESLTNVPPLDNFHPAHQTTVESLRIPVISPDSAIASDIVTSGITMPHPTPETSTSTPSLSSTSLPAAVALQHNAHLLTSSDPPNLLYSVSNTVPDNILPTGTPLSSHSPITRSYPSPSCL